MILGATDTVTAISHLSVTASWAGLTPREEVANAIYNPPPGWVIRQTQVVVHSSSNGSRQVSVIAGGLNLVTEAIISDVYDAAIELAGKLNDKNLEGKLNDKKAWHRNEVLRYASNKNTIQAQVRARAHGTPLDRKRGWEEISVLAEIMYLGSPSSDEVAAAIEAEFLIDIPGLGTGA